MTNLSQEATEFANTVVAKVMGKPVTQGELSAAFDRVASTVNWKNPIDTVEKIQSDFEMELIREAIKFFTGSIATFEARGSSHYTVRAAGYYLTIGA